MAHYTATVTFFEHEDHVSASLKVWRVYDYGARPVRPVWSDTARIERPPASTPREWLEAVLGGRL